MHSAQAATSFHGYWGELRHFRLSRAQLKSIGLRLLNNHVLWACLIGTVLSLSKIGPKWLNPGGLAASTGAEAWGKELHGTLI